MVTTAGDRKDPFELARPIVRSERQRLVERLRAEIAHAREDLVRRGFWNSGMARLRIRGLIEAAMDEIADAMWRETSRVLEQVRQTYTDSLYEDVRRFLESELPEGTGKGLVSRSYPTLDSVERAKEVETLEIKRSQALSRIDHEIELFVEGLRIGGQRTGEASEGRKESAWRRFLSGFLAVTSGISIIANAFYLYDRFALTSRPETSSADKSGITLVSRLGQLLSVHLALILLLYLAFALAWLSVRHPRRKGVLITCALVPAALFNGCAFACWSTLTDAFLVVPIALGVSVAWVSYWLVRGFRGRLCISVGVAVLLFPLNAGLMAHFVDVPGVIAWLCSMLASVVGWSLGFAVTRIHRG